MSKKLNLGCGKDIKPDYINLDRVKLPGVDVVHDLNKFPWPFKNNEFDEILCKHVIEHLMDFGKTMKEIHRIIKPGGVVKIIVPHFTSKAAFDPTHKHFFTYDTFDCFLKNWQTHYYYDFHFDEITKKKIMFGKKYAIWNWIIEPIANLFPNIYENTILRIFPAMELYVQIVKRE